MTDEEYWQERTTDIESKWFNKCRTEVEKELASYYMSASQHIQDDIAVLYARFADDNNLSITNARKLIQGNEFSSWRMDIEGYLKQIEIAPNEKAKKRLLKELNTLAMRSRINILEKLHGETLLELAKLATLTELDMTDFFKRCYADTYYRDLFAIGQKIGLDPKQARMDNERLEKVLAVPWSGRNYSTRIWDNQQKLAQNIKETVMNGVHRGLSVPKMSAEVAKRMEVGKSQAVRLVRTEMNYVQNQANLDSIRSSGLKYYRFCATLDSRTSAQCRAKDGKIFPVDEAHAGVNLPPLHPHCRSTVVASLKADSKARGWRVAKNKDDERITVDAKMTYSDWKKVFIDRTQTLRDWSLEQNKTAPDNPFGFASIKGKHSIEDDLAKVNPNHTSKKYEWVNNCQRCVWAYEARRRGYDVTALPLPTAISDDKLAHLLSSDGFSSVAKDGLKDMRRIGKNSGAATMKAINETVLEYGNGARCAVTVRWKGKNGGHVFVVENDNGMIRYLDPQSNNMDVTSYFNPGRITPSLTIMLRMDNKTFTNIIKECCKSEV